MKNLIKNNACNLLTINAFGVNLYISYLCISFFDILDKVFENIIVEKFSQIINTLTIKINNMKKINYNKETKEYTFSIKASEKAIIAHLLNSVKDTFSLEYYNDKAKKKIVDEITRRRLCDFFIEGNTLNGQPINVNALCSLLKIFNRDFRRFDVRETNLKEVVDKYYKDNIERIRKNRIYISI